MRRTLSVFLVLLMLIAATPALAMDNLLAWTLAPAVGETVRPKAMALSASGGVYVAGATNVQDGSFGEGYAGLDAFVSRIGANGDILWQKRFGGSGDDEFTRVIELSGGGCVAMGKTTSSDGQARAARGGVDAFLVRLSAAGELIFAKCLGGSLDDELLDLVETEDGNLLVCGRTMSRNGDLGANMGGWDAWIAALSPEDGKPLYKVDRYGDAGDDQFSRLCLSRDGWIALGEYGEARQATEDGVSYRQRPIVLLYGSDGARAWTEPVMLGDMNENRLLDIVETDTGWLFFGETNSRSAMMPTRGGLDLWVLHLRQNGIVSWQRNYGGSLDERAFSARFASPGGYVLLATTASDDHQVTGAHGDDDLWVVRISANGALEWQQTLGGSERSSPAGLIRVVDGSYLVAGSTLSQDGDIGRHASLRAGFLSSLESNGNLRWTSLVGDGQECTLIDFQARDREAYLLGVIRVLDSAGLRESLYLARLSPEVFPRAAQ